MCNEAVLDMCGSLPGLGTIVLSAGVSIGFVTQINYDEKDGF